MKLLHVVPTYVPAWRHGGPILAVHGLCKALAARGHEVTVFTTDVHGTGTLDVERAAPVDVDGVTVWYFPVRTPRRLYRSPALGVALARRVGNAGRRPPAEGSGFDLLHLHSLFLWPTAAAARAAEKARVPYLVAPRGMLVGDLLRRRGRLRKRLWIDLVERRTLAQAAALHVTSELEAAEAARLGLRLPPARVVPNGVDLEPWPAGGGAAVAAPVRAALTRRPLLLFLGRVSWKKGLDRLVRALALLPDATLAIAGNDEEGYRPTLEALAGAAGVTARIVYLGPVHGGDKACLLHGADLLVLPSYSENFANVVLEAMAAGLPVAVSPEVGLAPLVRQAGAGIVIEGEAPRWAAALAALLADPEGRQAMGRRGEAAARQFSWEVIAARMEAVYGEILAAGRNGAGRGVPADVGAPPSRRNGAAGGGPPPLAGPNGAAGGGGT